MAILVAVSLTMLLIVTAMVLDFGLVRLERQQSKADSDSAAMAGIKAGDGGTGDVFTYRAACGALTFLRVSDPKLSSLPDGICSTASLTANQNVKCTTAAATHAIYSGTATSGSASYHVVIKAPYDTTEGNFSEESYSTLASDRSTLDNGCDQVGVLITGSRPPGLGSLATSGDLAYTVRSASRALIGGQDSLAPALILLERTACSALTVGSAGGGAGTYINVKGASLPLETPPVNTPGSIHLDSSATGADCGSGSNKQLIQGKQDNGIVAYGAGGVSGIITSKATFDGRAANIVYDDDDYVYGTTASSGTGGSHSAVQGRDTVGRTPVDARYRTAVRTAVSAVSGVWGLNPSNPGPGWTRTTCNPSPADLALMPPAKLYIDCSGNSGITISGSIRADEIFFNGFVKGGNIEMPNATRVYVNNPGAKLNAITLGGSDGFCLRGTCGLTNADKCYPGGTPTASSVRARLFVRQGDVDLTGGLLRLCRTTAILMGGSTSTACVPTTDGASPSLTPCSGVGTTPAGNSKIGVAGQASIDWTAPNEYAGSIPTANRTAAWSDFEDLAMWSESYGTYSFSGGGALNTVGVLMAPNAAPFQLGGGSNQTLVNAQYVARTFSVSGGGTLSLTTDPRNAVTIKGITGYLLVR